MRVSEMVAISGCLSARLCVCLFMLPAVFVAAGTRPAAVRAAGREERRVSSSPASLSAANNLNAAAPSLPAAPSGGRKSKRAQKRWPTFAAKYRTQAARQVGLPTAASNKSRRRKLANAAATQCKRANAAAAAANMLGDAVIAASGLSAKHCVPRHLRQDHCVKRSSASAALFV